MNKEKNKQAQKLRRHGRVRVKIAGTAERPRLSVYRSNQNLYLQLIDDVGGKTLLSIHSREVKGANKTEVALALGKELAVKALAKNIKEIVFDRGGNLYHGRVKAVADGAREGGLIF